jgi:hypothetical protein
LLQKPFVHLACRSNSMRNSGNSSSSWGSVDCVRLLCAFYGDEAALERAPGGRGIWQVDDEGRGKQLHLRSRCC